MIKGAAERERERLAKQVASLLNVDFDSKLGVGRNCLALDI